MHRLTDIHPGLLWRNSGWGGFRDIHGETELCGFGPKPGVTAAIVSVELSFHTAGRQAPSFVC